MRLILFVFFMSINMVWSQTPYKEYYEDGKIKMESSKRDGKLQGNTKYTIYHMHLISVI